MISYTELLKVYKSSKKKTLSDTLCHRLRVRQEVYYAKEQTMDDRWKTIFRKETLSSPNMFLTSLKSVMKKSENNQYFAHFSLI